MGVHGLWQLISSTGKPVPLESLEGKVLAVDVSVWLHQLSKGMRDGSGNPVPNAHLHGLFTRICKLLHCRIKPVFVFDGGVPALKKQTLTNRKSRREDAEKTSELMQQKILTNLIRSQVLQAAAGDATGPIGPYYTKPKSKSEKDTIFQLPPIPETSKRYLNENLHQEEAFIERRELQALIEEEYEDLNQINVDSEDFKSLPAEIQHEIIYDIQQNRKNYNMSKIAELPSESDDFSSYQMSKLLKHSKLHSRLEEVRKEINNRQTQDLSKYYSQDLYGTCAQSHRLVSDETSHVLLIKGLKNKQQNLEEEELKKKKEREKRKKNMKLLQKVFPEFSEESSYTDELQQDSENEDIKDIDFLKIDQKGFSNKIVADNRGHDTVTDTQNGLTDNTRIDQEMIDNKELIGKKVKFEPIEQVKETRILIDNVTKLSGQSGKQIDKPRFRPVIEVETDSSDEDGYEMPEASGSGNNPSTHWSDNVDTIVINDEVIDSEDEEMQLAIALSLQQDTTNTHKPSDKALNQDNGNTGKLGNDREAMDEQVVEKSKKLSVEQGSSKKGIDISDKLIDKSSTEKNRSQESSKLGKQNMSILDKLSKRHKLGAQAFLEKQSRSRKKQKKSLKKSKYESKRQKAFSQSKSGACIFKRQVSNLSIEDIDEDPVPRKIIRTESEDSDDLKGDVEETRDDNGENEVRMSDDSEDDFIEVKFDPNKIQEDELFPSSMFDVEDTPTKQEDVDSSSEEREEKSSEIISEDSFETREVTISQTTEPAKTLSKTVNNSDIHQSDSVLQDKIVCKRSDLSEKQLLNKNLENTANNQEHNDNEIESKNLDVESKDPDENGYQGSANTPESKMIKDINDDNATNANVVLSEDVDTSLILSQESQVSAVSQLSAVSTGSHQISESGESVEENVGSPKVSSKDLVKEYQAMDEWNIRGMRDGLVKEGKALLQERGRQERLAMSITDQMHTEAQELLGLFGIPYIVSPTEAEAQCAQLDYSKQTQGTITDDSDIWLFGGTCVYKNFFNLQKHVECFRMESIQNKLGLTRQALINIALLCGSDYTDGIQGVGPVTAMEILAEFPGEGIQGLKHFRTWWEKAQTDIKVRAENKLRVKLRDLEVKEGFPFPNVVDAYLNPTVDDSSDKFTWGAPDLDQLRQYAVEKLGWTKVKVDETLQPVLKRLNDRQNQMRISAYFQPEIYMQPAKVKSKRLQNVVNKFLNPDGNPDPNSDETEVDKTIEGKSQKPKRSNKNTKTTKDKVPEGLENKQTQSRKSKQSRKVIKNKQSDVDEKEKKDPNKKKDDNVSNTIESAKSSDKIAGHTEVSQRTSRMKSKKVNYVEESDTSVDTDDDSSDGEINDSDDDIVEAGLDVSEILGLTIGPSDKNDNNEVQDESEKEVSHSSQRVFVSGLNLDEIMRLESGQADLQSMETEENAFEKWDSNLKSNESDDDTNVKNDNQLCQSDIDGEFGVEIDYTNEGGFFKDESEDDQMEENTQNENDIKHQPKAVAIKQQPSRKRKLADACDVATEGTKKSKRQTRTTKVKKTMPANAAYADNGNMEETVIKSDNKDEKLIRDAESNDLDKEKALQFVKVEPEDTDSNKDTSTYTENPIKKLLTGVPWEKKASKRGRSTKGSSKGKLLKVEPTEKLQRKKEAAKMTRKPVGVVNLSESSSDSD